MPNGAGQYQPGLVSGPAGSRQKHYGLSTLKGANRCGQSLFGKVGFAHKILQAKGC